MKKLLVAFICLMFVASCGSSKERKANKDDRRAIENVMRAQEREWNENDLEGFMQSYWKSNDLRFYGSSGLTSGWEKTLENYKIKYPNKDHTGILKFDLDNISKISEDSYYVMGRYSLERKAGNANGNFMVIFKKINGLWKIIADMSS